MAEVSDDKQQQIIEEFRQIVLAQSDLIPCTEDGFLLKFLRTWNFDSDKALQLLRNYYKLFKDNPEMYNNFSPSSPSMMRIWDQNFAVLLPKPDEHGRRILAVSLGKWDTSKSSFNEVFTALHMCLEVMIEDDVELQKNGLVMIHNYEGIGFQHIKQCSPSNVKKMITLVEDSFPTWFHAFHLVNGNTFFNIIFTLILPILSKTMRDRVFIHGSNWDSLHKHIGPNILPEEFGGVHEPVDSKEGIEKMFKYEDHLQKLKSFGYKNALNKI